MDIVLKTIYFNVNKGLGNTLKEILYHCSNNLVTRMNSDDITFFDKFERQHRCFINHPDVDFVGGNIAEFICNPNEKVFERAVNSNNGEIKENKKGVES